MQTLDALCLQTDAREEKYLNWCYDSGNIALERLALPGCVENKIMDAKEGVPGLGLIAHSLVTGFKIKTEKALPFEQKFLPDLLRLFFIAADFDEDYIAVAANWFRQCSEMQLLDNPDCALLWWMYKQREDKVEQILQQSINVGLGYDKQKLYRALLLGDDDAVIQYSTCLKNKGVIPGWETIPIEHLAIRAYIMLF